MSERRWVAVLACLALCAIGCGTSAIRKPPPSDGATETSSGGGDTSLDSTTATATSTGDSWTASAPPCGCYYGDGAYCGAGVRDYAAANGCSVPEVVGNEGNVLLCSGGAWSVQTACPSGSCVVEPPGYADVCSPAPNEYVLPWTCGDSWSCTQGNGGDICSGSGGDHTDVQEYAWDFGMARGEPVRAARAGTVSLAAAVVGPGEPCYDGCTQPFGSPEFWTCCYDCINTSNHVNVDHGDGTVATYWHLDSVAVSTGAQVDAGDVLGYSGTSGCSSGPHLHFMVMGDCPTGYCQSVPISFTDGGVPACGDQETSGNCP